MALPQLQDKYITINGLKLRYLEAGSGRPTLFLHALNPRACADEWLNSVEAYTAAGCHMFMLDLPGWSLSEGPKDGKYHFSVWTNAVKGFCDAMKLDRVDMVGRTMGGWVSAVFAHQYPQRVRRLVLYNNAGLNPRPPLNYNSLSTMPSLESLRSAYKDDVVAQRVYDRLHEPGRVERFQQVLNYVLDQKVREEWGLRQRLPETRTPMLFAMRDNTGEMSTQYAIEGFQLAPVSRLFVTKGDGAQDTGDREIQQAGIAFLTAPERVPVG